MGAEQTIVRPDEGVASDVAAAFEVLQRLLRDQSWDPGLDGIDISIGDDGTGVAYGTCTIKIKADTAANLEELKKGVKTLGDKNWSCTNNPGSDKEATCTNPPPKP